MILDQFLTPN